MRVFIITLLLCIVACCSGDAAFESQDGKRSLVLGEISSYVGKNFKQEFYHVFYDQLVEELHLSKEFKVVYRENYSLTAEAEKKISEAHMEAIIFSGDYEAKNAVDKLYFFAQKNKALPVTREKISSLTAHGLDKLNVFDNVDMVLFVNITDLEVISSLLNSAPGMKPLSMKFNIDYVYYLVDRHNGMIYRKKLTSNRHSGATYMSTISKQFSLNDIAKMSLRAAAKDIVKELCGARRM